MNDSTHPGIPPKIFDLSGAHAPANDSFDLAEADYGREEADRQREAALAAGAKERAAARQPTRPGFTQASQAVLATICQDFILLTGREAMAYHIESGDKMGKEAFCQYAAAHYAKLVKIVESPGGGLKSEESYAGPIWWNMHDKIIARQLVVDPSLPLFGGGVFNRWPVLRRRQIEPDLSATEDDIKPLLDHLMFLSDEDEVGVKFFMNWLATLYQFPHIKMPTAIMFYTPRSRMGKSMLFKLLAPVLSEPLCTELPGEALHGRFAGDDLDGKQLVFLNELAQADRRDSYERFKTFVSEKSARIEGKGKASRRVRNIFHFIVATNNADCLPLMQGDGRILVLRTDAERQPQAYYDEFGAWVEGPGPELLAGVLANWQFPKDWNPLAPVPQTASTVLTQEESRHPLVGRLIEAIEERHPPFDKDFASGTTLHTDLGLLSALRGVTSDVLTKALGKVPGVRRYRLNFYAHVAGKRQRITTRGYAWRNHEGLTDEELNAAIKASLEATCAKSADAALVGKLPEIETEAEEVLQ